MRIASLIFGLTLAGCAAAPPELAPGYEILDQDTCVSWGAAVGTPAHAQCRMTLLQNRTAAMQARAARSNAVAGALAQNQAQREPRASRSPDAPLLRTMCYRRGEQISGMNKICFYDCLGSAHAITLNSFSLCPLTVEQ